MLAKFQDYGRVCAVVYYKDYQKHFWLSGIFLIMRKIIDYQKYF